MANYTLEPNKAVKKNKVNLHIPMQKDVLDILFCMILFLLKNKMEGRGSDKQKKLQVCKIYICVCLVIEENLESTLQTNKHLGNGSGDMSGKERLELFAVHI